MAETEPTVEERLARELAQQQLDDVQAVMATPQGRRLLLRLRGPGFCNLDGPISESSDFLRGAREGQRSVWHLLDAELKRCAFDNYLLAEGEQLAERKRRAELMKLAP